MVKVTTTNIFYQRGLYFSEQETGDNQENLNLLIGFFCRR